MWNRLTPAQFTALVDQCPDPMVVIDADTQVVAANAAMQSLAGMDPADMAHDHPLLEPVSGEPVLEFPHSDGRVHSLRLTAVELGDGLRARIFQDHTRAAHLERERQRLTREIAAQSLTDPVTGLLNLRGLVVALDPQVSRSRRYGNPLSLVTMQIYGSDVDDALLQRVSHVLKDQLRWADMVGCSDEPYFILALPETRRDDAMKMIEKVQNRLTAELCEKDAWSAYGIVEWDRADTTQRLLDRSRAALMQAREQTDTCAIAL